MPVRQPSFSARRTRATRLRPRGRRVRREFDSAVHPAAVHNQNLVAAAQAFDGPCDVALLVESDDGGRDFHGRFTTAGDDGRVGEAEDENHQGNPPEFLAPTPSVEES